MWTTEGGGDTQTLLAVKKLWNFLNSRVAGMQKLWTQALLPRCEPSHSHPCTHTSAQGVTWWNFHYLYRTQTKFAKVMFLHVSVCPQGVVSQHALQVVSQHALQVSRKRWCITACLAGFHDHTQGGAWGVWLGGGWCIPACTEADPTWLTATAAGGAHPTGMHSCSFCVFSVFIIPYYGGSLHGGIGRKPPCNIKCACLKPWN